MAEGPTFGPNEPGLALPLHKLRRTGAKILLSCVIFLLELAACLVLFVVVRMFIVRKTIVEKLSDATIQGRGVQPQLFFACCEANLTDVQSILSNPDKIATLKNLHAGIAVDLADLTSERAQIVRQFNADGIPVIAWLVLAKEEGYYINADNAPQASARFDQFQEWTKENSLHWSAIGLDIEPDIRDFDEWGAGHKGRLLAKLVERLFDFASPQRSRRSYDALVARIQSQGYAVQTYQMPFIVNGRKENSTLFERLFGVVDVRGNLEVLMLYTSATRAIGPAMIWKFGPDAQAIAVGSTESDPASPPLNWDEFSRDLVIASHFTPTVGVYDLEGTERQGFLPRMAGIDWSRSVVIAAQQIRQVTLLGYGIQTLSWAVSHLEFFVGFILVIDLFWLWLRRPVRAHRA